MNPRLFCIGAIAMALQFVAPASALAINPTAPRPARTGALRINNRVPSVMRATRARAGVYVRYAEHVVATARVDLATARAEQRAALHDRSNPATNNTGITGGIPGAPLPPAVEHAQQVRDGVFVARAQARLDRAVQRLADRRAEQTAAQNDLSSPNRNNGGITGGL